MRHCAVSENHHIRGRRSSAAAPDASFGAKAEGSGLAASGPSRTRRPRASRARRRRYRKTRWPAPSLYRAARTAQTQRLDIADVGRTRRKSETIAAKRQRYYLGQQIPPLKIAAECFGAHRGVLDRPAELAPRTVPGGIRHRPDCARRNCCGQQKTKPVSVQERCRAPRRARRSNERRRYCRRRACGARRVLMAECRARLERLRSARSARSCSAHDAPVAVFASANRTILPSSRSAFRSTDRSTGSPGLSNRRSPGGFPSLLIRYKL